MREESILEILDAANKRRTARRSFLRASAGAAAAVGGLSLLAACSDDPDNGDINVFTPQPAPVASSMDIDVLNFALQLEYLEAQFYSYAVNGTGLAANLQLGVGTQGAVVTGSGAGAPRAVDFTGETVIQEYAREIAADELAHVTFLRATLGNAAVAQPAINISGDAGGAFTAAARAAGVVSSTGTFDPYASPNNFLIGAFIFEDVGVTAYKGAAPLLTNKTYLEASAGILAAEAYHAGLVRTILYNRGQTTPALITQAGQISDARDSLDGASDDDQGIAAAPVTITTSAGATTATGTNLAPTDGNALAYGRNTNQVLHIVYLNATAGTTSGGFFPAGLNGNIKAAAANP